MRVAGPVRFAIQPVDSGCAVFVFGAQVFERTFQVGDLPAADGPDILDHRIGGAQAPQGDVPVLLHLPEGGTLDAQPAGGLFDRFGPFQLPV